MEAISELIDTIVMHKPRHMGKGKPARRYQNEPPFVKSAKHMRTKAEYYPCKKCGVEPHLQSVGDGLTMCYVCVCPSCGVSSWARLTPRGAVRSWILGERVPIGQALMCTSEE